MPNSGDHDALPADDRVADSPQRLWAPWRMRYVGGGAKEAGCLFCHRAAGEEDVSGLVLHRSDRSFVIMNLFPYNTGHVMTAPYDHVATPEVADPASLAEMATLTGPVMRALRRALGCDGFNLGTNVGSVAGAGIADHLHHHLVPRWQGDANFMPILAGTMVMPELIPVTYAKLRAEIEREIWGLDTMTLVILSQNSHEALVGSDDRLPTVEAVSGTPIWRTAVLEAERISGCALGIERWVGERYARKGSMGLALRVKETPSGEPKPPRVWRSATGVAAGIDGAMMGRALLV